MIHLFCTKHLMACIAVIALIVTVTVSPGAAIEEQPQVPVPGMVTMLDLGAQKCIPCKMMAPIIEELEKEYKDRAAIVFIDVWATPEAGRKFHVQTIPTQIFYDATGKEVFRHVGFFDKPSIIAELQKLGVK